jgi:hypothetical protein
MSTGVIREGSVLRRRRTEGSCKCSQASRWALSRSLPLANTSERTRSAAVVDRVLADPSYRTAAARLGAEIAESPGVAGILPIIERHASAVRAG